MAKAASSASAAAVAPSPQPPAKPSPAPPASSAADNPPKKGTKTKAKKPHHQQGATPLKFKKCPKCGKSNAIFEADSHQWCFACLGPQHNPASCTDCQSLGIKSCRERAQRLLWWRHSGKLLPNSEVKEMACTAHPPPQIARSEVDELLGIASDSTEDEVEVARVEPVPSGPKEAEPFCLLSARGTP